METSRQLVKINEHDEDHIKIFRIITKGTLFEHFGNIRSHLWHLKGDSDCN